MAFTALPARKRRDVRCLKKAAADDSAHRQRHARASPPANANVMVIRVAETASAPKSAGPHIVVPPESDGALFRLVGTGEEPAEEQDGKRSQEDRGSRRKPRKERSVVREDIPFDDGEDRGPLES